MGNDNGYETQEWHYCFISSNEYRYRNGSESIFDIKNYTMIVGTVKQRSPSYQDFVPSRVITLTPAPGGTKLLRQET